MRILITGATGFLGKKLLPALMERGHDVVAVSRSAERARSTLPGLVAAYDWDPRAEPCPADALRVDAVVHLLGESVAGRWTARKREAIAGSRKEGTRHLVEGIAALPVGERPKLILSASAVGYYGDRGEEEITEQTAGGQDFLAEVCSDWEHEVETAGALGLRWVTMRMPLLVDPDGGALEQMLPLAKLGMGGPLGSGRQWWCWVSAHDVVRFVVDAVADPSFEGAYNVCSPVPVRQREFAKTLGRVLGRPAFLPAPAFVLKTVLGAFSIEVLGSKRQIPERLNERGWEFVDRELEAALRRMLG
ncbi:MAG: TIGR01777 family oxidoreductase [Deltaproteobacteria bacterium]|nr:TIGR01777 family oxidoreductase [Deltaproteobacteria bacterium]